MKILTAFAAVLSINVASADLVVYEGTATVTSPRNFAPFTSVGAAQGDVFRFRAIVDTATPGSRFQFEDGSYDTGRRYTGAILKIDFWVRDIPVVMPEALSPSTSLVYVANNVLIQEYVPYLQDRLSFAYGYTAIDGLRYSFDFILWDNVNHTMLSSEAIATEINYSLSTRQGISFMAWDDFAISPITPSMITSGFTIIPLSVVNLLQDLRTASEGVGPGKSLANKVILAQTYYAVPDLVSTCAVLADYVTQTAHKKVPAVQGAALAEDARLITSVIGCE